MTLPFATSDEFQSNYGAKAYVDRKKGAGFIEFLRRRLILVKEIMSEDGVIYVHLDQKMSHYIKVVLDEVFGKNHFCNEIIWQKINNPKKQSSSFGNVHDIIFIYKKI